MTMPGPIRAGVAVLGVLAGVLAVGFVFEVPLVTDLWPWPDGRYSYLFIGSIAAAISAAAAWVWHADDYGALAPGALNVAVIGWGQSVYLLILWNRRDEAVLLTSAVVLGLLAVASTVLWWRSTQHLPRDDQAMPPVVRASFAVFVAALLAAGLSMVIGGAEVFPWELRPDTTVMFGWIFLGDACFFAYGLVRPLWAYAAPQLLAFLAYDLVLIGPFLGLIGDVPPGHGTNLLVYTAVLVASGAVAVWFLFVHRPTRLLGAGEMPRATPAGGS